MRSPLHPALIALEDNSVHSNRVLRLCNAWTRFCSYLGSHRGTNSLYKACSCNWPTHMLQVFRLPVRHLQCFTQKCYTRYLRQIKSIKTQAQSCNGSAAVANSSQALSSVSHHCVTLHSVARRWVSNYFQFQFLLVFFFFLTEMLPFLLVPFLICSPFDILATSTLPHHRRPSQDEQGLIIWHLDLPLLTPALKKIGG